MGQRNEVFVRYMVIIIKPLKKHVFGQPYINFHFQITFLFDDIKNS